MRKMNELDLRFRIKISDITKNESLCNEGWISSGPHGNIDITDTISLFDEFNKKYEYKRIEIEIIGWRVPQDDDAMKNRFFDLLREAIRTGYIIPDRLVE